MAYIGKSPSQGVRNRFQYQATAGQQTFSSADANGLTLTYTDSLYMDVYQNGILLVPGDDYTATTGTTVVLVQAASADDIVEMVVYDVFSVNDSVSASSGGTFSGNVVMGGDLTIPDKIIHSGDTNTAMRFPSADTISFETGGSERARVDSSGNLLVGKTSSGIATAGIELRANDDVLITSNGSQALYLNRLSSDGAIAEFRKDGTVLGKIEVLTSASSQDIYVGNQARGLKFRDAAVLPRAVSDGSSNGAQDLGSSSSRFNNIFAVNTTISSSDKNVKQDIEELSDAEKRVAVAAKSLMRKYRWKDAVAEKGDNARIHFGIIAQDLQDAFTAEGLDASKYAMFCSDTWWEKEIKYTDDDGAEKTKIMDYEKEEDAPEDATKITRLGVRYSELLAFIISAI